MITSVVGFALIILGGIMSLLQKYMSAIQKQSFAWGIFWKDNLAMSLFNVIFGISALISIYFYNKDFRQMVDGFNYVGLIWVAVGFAGHYFWQLIFSLFKNLLRSKIKKLKK